MNRHGRFDSRRDVLLPRPLPQLILHLGAAPTSAVSQVPLRQSRVSKVLEVAPCSHTRGTQDPRHLSCGDAPIGRTQLTKDGIQRLGRDSLRQVAMTAITPAGQQIVYLRLRYELRAPSPPVAIIAVALETLSHYRERNRLDKAVKYSVAQG